MTEIDPPHTLVPSDDPALDDPGSERPDTERPDTVEGWEQLRRSVAMLNPGAWALRREQALEVLTALVRSSRP